MTGSECATRTQDALTESDLEHLCHGVGGGTPLAAPAPTGDPGPRAGAAARGGADARRNGGGRRVTQPGVKRPSGNGGPPSSIIIEHVAPELDCGRYPVKREVGDVLTVAG